MFGFLFLISIINQPTIVFKQTYIIAPIVMVNEDRHNMCECEEYILDDQPDIMD